MSSADSERGTRRALSQDQVIRSEFVMRLLTYPLLTWAIVDESPWGAAASAILVVLMGLLSIIVVRRKRYLEVVLFVAIAVLAVVGHWVAAPHVTIDMRLFR